MPVADCSTADRLPPPCARPPAPAELPTLADSQLLQKHLKANADELAVGSLADAQLMRIAVRDC